jgi:glucan phosphoethanolaminetransferase (alkaline phosphatase superfamily)
MNKQPKQTNIQKDVMSKIKNNSIRMKPRAYFTAMWVFGVLAAIAASLTFSYLISMVFYYIRIQTALTPAYGARRNLNDAISEFPWWLVILTVMFSVVALWLLGKYSRLYRLKLIYIITVFVLISLILGLVLSYSSIGHRSNKSINSRQKSSHIQDDSFRGYRYLK